MLPPMPFSEPAALLAKSALEIGSTTVVTV
jgi:hypothetical protein